MASSKKEQPTASRGSHLLKVYRKPALLYIVIFFGFLLLHAFIFRDVIAAIPSIVAGDTSIVREELVPFFDISTQFWSENTSELTSSDEVRVSYSFWTSWVRHNTVLPFALVVLNALSATILFHAFYKIGRYFAAKRQGMAILTALLAALLIHFILLYAKVTHFYTLVFGFSMFAWSISLVLEQLFFSRELKLRSGIVTVLVVLLNPAIHYHVIFYFVFAVFILLHGFFTLILNRSWFWFYLKRNTKYFLVITVASLIPYIAFIMLTAGDGASSASVDIPVNYWMIYYSSILLPSLFSLDTSAQIDMFRYGAYTIPSPRVFSMVAMFVVGSLFIMKQWVKLHVAKQVFLIALFIAMLMATWMAWGYSEDNILSFHRLMGGIALALTEQGNAIASAFGQGVAIFINILRFPHRFQFIFFYLVGVLFMVGLIWIYERLREKRRVATSLAVIVLLALSPLLLAKDYLLVLTSGNFASFLTPYPIPPDLKSVKVKLVNRHDDKLFILPSLENGRDIIKNGHRYGFIDKYLIYYLDQPTLYYGTGGDPKNKIISYMAYKAINDNKGWWDDILINDLGITHVLMPKNVHARKVGFSYMPEVDAKLPRALDSSDRFTRVYNGSDFALYEAVKKPSEDQTVVDMQWDELTRYMEQEKPEGRRYFPLQLADIKGRQIQYVTDSPERSYYNLYSTMHDDRTFYPSSVRLAFSKDFVASTSFTNNTLSLDTLDNARNDYNYLKERMPSLASLLRPQFIGVPPGKEQLHFRVSVPQDGMYRLLLHGASRSDQLAGAVAGKGVILNKIDSDKGKHRNYIDWSYFSVDVELSKGTHEIVLHNPGQAGLAAETMVLLPQSHIPSNFHHVNKAGIIMEQKDNQTFNVTLPGGK